MHDILSHPLFGAMFSVFKQLLFICYDATDHVLNIEQSLSVENMQRLQASQVCTLHMNRICNIFEYLYINKENTSTVSNKNTFEADHLLESIVENFANTVSGYAEVQVSFTAKAQASPVLIEKTRLELAVFNLLYCSLHNTENNAGPLKLALYITENKEQTIFHIRDNSKRINKEIIDFVFSGGYMSFDEDSLFDSVVALSLNAAVKATADMGGKLTYSALKSGNRYDIIIPKAQKTGKVYSAHSIATYTPTLSYLREILASIQVEELLRNHSKKGDEL